jgi:redox-sensing transcriptional repressor
VAIVGMGNLGRALAAYSGFATRGFNVIALLDHDDALVGTLVGEREIRPMADGEALVRTDGLAIGVIATPAESAQNVADRLVAAGVRSILNFAPCVLDVPDDVMVRKVDMSTELQILAFHEQRRTGELDLVAEPDVAEVAL